MGISAEVLALLEDIVSWRRSIHMHPELGFTEQRTSKLVCDALRSFGFDEVLTDFCKAHTAVVGILRTGRPGHVVGVLDNPAMGKAAYRGSSAYYELCNEIRALLRDASHVNEDEEACHA